MSRIPFLSLMLIISTCAYAEIQHGKILRMLDKTCPFHLYDTTLTILYGDPFETIDESHQDQAIAMLNRIFNEIRDDLNTETYDWLYDKLYSTRAPQPVSPGFSLLQEGDENNSEDEQSTSFAAAGGLATNDRTSNGFNFATDRSIVRQSGNSDSFNVATAHARIETKDSRSINFASGKSTIKSNQDTYDYNLVTCGSATNKSHSQAISLVSGDDTTQVTTGGTALHPTMGVNIVAGPQSKVTFSDGSQERASINLVASGANASNPPNGINLYPGNNEIHVFGTLNMKDNRIINAHVAVNSIESPEDVLLVYDTDDTNTTNNTDQALIVAEGSQKQTAFRVDKQSVTIHGRPLNMRSNAINNLATLSGARNSNLNLQTSATTGNTANIILEPGTGNGSGNLELRNLASGSGAPLVIDNGIVKEESSSRRFKHNIQSCDERTMELLLQLRPVSFTRTLDQIFREYGLIAEEVAQYIPDLVIYENDGVTPHSIKYHQLTALLLYLAQNQQKTIEHQQQEIDYLYDKVSQHEKSIIHILSAMSIDT